jgi:hypothetical protein
MRIVLTGSSGRIHGELLAIAARASPAARRLMASAHLNGESFDGRPNFTHCASRVQGIGGERLWRMSAAASAGA